jgi:hypothetical protein
MTQIESWPLAVWGNLVIKSMEISSHFQTEIGKGYRKLGLRRWSALTLPQISHSAIYLVISCFMFDHQYN